MDPKQQDLFARDVPPWELDSQGTVTAALVVFAEPPFGPFHYAIPERLLGSLQAGMRLKVPLGRGNREVIGYCTGIETLKQSPESLKPVTDLVDLEPLCTPHLLKLIQWMSRYYIVPLGQVFEAVVPSGVRSAAGTREKVFLRVAPEYISESAQQSLTVKQRQIVHHLQVAGGVLAADQLKQLAGCAPETLQRLKRQGVLLATTERVMSSMLPAVAIPREAPPALSVDQRQALMRVQAAIDKREQQTVLLHGITGSGKTEIYIQAIEYVLTFGMQAIVLVPEISLTPQTRRRFQQRLGNIAVLHSHMSGPERHHQWRKILSGEATVVIGPRSAVFAPVPRLGLIILDEEHDSSFKQDTIPRYHARDVALQRSMFEGTTVLLGSATPSLESWNRTVQKKYELVSLPRRIHNRPLPEVEIVDLRLQKSQPNRGSLSRPLLQAIHETIQTDDGQVILLLNRRGFATAIQCPKCGHVATCPDCDLSLTHHHDGSKAVCHYCDFTIPTPPRCPECGFEAIQYSGQGTQRLEMEVKGRFPGVSLARMDSDTMKKPGSHEKVLGAFRNGEIKILLGTQMIAKGLDFPNVLLVGVVNADTALHFPDFRAAERTFQLVTQVAGRTGRGERRGRVLVQTFSPEHPAIQYASKHDFIGFAGAELLVRQRLVYPPWGYLARVIIRGPKLEETEAFANNMVKQLEKTRDQLGVEVRILGPAPPPIAKLRAKYRFHAILQCKEPEPLNRLLMKQSAEWKAPDEVQWVIDIDPVDML